MTILEVRREGDVSISVLKWGKNEANPMHCGQRTYKLYIATHRYGRVHVGYYCPKCRKMMANGEEKQT